MLRPLKPMRRMSERGKGPASERLERTGLVSLKYSSFLTRYRIHLFEIKSRTTRLFVTAALGGVLVVGPLGNSC